MSKAKAVKEPTWRELQFLARWLKDDQCGEDCPHCIAGDITPSEAKCHPCRIVEVLKHYADEIRPVERRKQK